MVIEIFSCSRVSSIDFWDSYARWYKLWIEHTYYHERILKMLKKIVRSGQNESIPKWRVLDIGAGNGVLSIPLLELGWEVTALEPSIEMRRLFYEEVSKKGINSFALDERKWERVPWNEYVDYDLMIACNTIHLTQMGLSKALFKVFRMRPKNFFLITEFDLREVQKMGFYEGYNLIFLQSFEMDDSFVYHNFDEMVDHCTFLKGYPPKPKEMKEWQRRIILKENHLWIKETSQVKLYWWRRKEVKHF
ncbi:MAG: class I SAM-dependent methyltransferase [Thermodesulfobacteriota bacterium]